MVATVDEAPEGGATGELRGGHCGRRRTTCGPVGRVDRRRGRPPVVVPWARYGGDGQNKRDVWARQPSWWCSGARAKLKRHCSLQLPHVLKTKVSLSPLCDCAQPLGLCKRAWQVAKVVEAAGGEEEGGGGEATTTTTTSLRARSGCARSVESVVVVRRTAWLLVTLPTFGFALTSSRPVYCAATCLCFGFCCLTRILKATRDIGGLRLGRRSRAHL